MKFSTSSPNVSVSWHCQGCEAVVLSPFAKVAQWLLDLYADFYQYYFCPRSRRHSSFAEFVLVQADKILDKL